MKSKFLSYSLAGAGLVAVSIGMSANAANAFVITNTSATWDNVTLTNGNVVGSLGEAASDDNHVVFREVDGESQVRWGEAVYGWTWEENWELETQEVEKTEKQRTHGWYQKRNGRWKKGWHWETVTTVETVEEWVDNGSWVEPTADFKSGLGFAGVTDLSLTVGEVFSIGSLTHYNQTIWSDVAFGTAADFSLALDFGDSNIGSQTFDFTFAVDETLNSQTVCPYQTTAGQGCSDRISWDFAVDETSSFMHNGEEYTLELVELANQVAANGIVNDFISQEKANNSADLFAKLVKVDPSKDIPEPASMLGLAGFGLFFLQSRQKRMLAYAK